MIEVTFYGHSAFLITIDGKKVLFDPFITPNDGAKSIDISKISPDYILVSHGHADHVADVEEIAKQSGAMLVSNFEIVSWFQKKGIENVHPMNHGGSKVFDFGKVKYVNAIHSSTLPDDSPGGNPGGFVVETKHGSFYYAGDTALTYDMKLIGEEFSIDFALLPIGDNFTMGIEDALKAADFVGTDRVIGMHYDTFPYILLDKEQAQRKALEAHKELILLEIGEKIILGNN
ncbi:MAG: metal-dependent hydrolase [Lunatimonas sp.]|uniref:metal-dependent hydrolase n=1 Tax=Lunatimonas sp. TaxID=2060141 RepID=UPI00263AEA09|nr:metal-dependent hydrolase [Lunatimonas sp.]MCC5937660.1 metal-dependent hydrolase [Lunatimonas sp.]